MSVYEHAASPMLNTAKIAIVCSVAAGFASAIRDHAERRECALRRDRARITHRDVDRLHLWDPIAGYKCADYLAGALLGIHILANSGRLRLF